ncbi:hypothetical protein LY76DRAFT_673085 [Colletotrichum caudatum]|nr:hypothetical protein LY76DRAFT_673085 [Colletotrichum caudatum]
MDECGWPDIRGEICLSPTIEMVLPRKSNEERAEWREKCRKKLADHLNVTLGLTIEPSDVRLKPDGDDPYRWKILPGQEHIFGHLFEKQMSKQSKGVYMELWREVGRSFEAVAYGAHDENDGNQFISFSQQIDALYNENARLEHDSSWWRQKAEAAEREYSQLLRDHQKLELQRAEMIDRFSRYRSITLRTLQEACRTLEEFELEHS